MDQIRIKRIEEQIRDLIASLLASGDVKDYRVGQLVSVTRVECAHDLSFAKVYISAIDIHTPVGQEDKTLDSIKKSAEGLQSAAGYIQKRIAKNLHTRLTPKLRFYPDIGIALSADFSNKLKNIL